MSIIFQNPGLAEIKALTTIGVNVKEEAKAIGYFGTGFKFAIATLLRHGAEIELWLGAEHHTFNARTETIRAQSFQIVHFDDQPLGFTTMMGKDWALWQCFRELHSNALDEGGDSARGKRPTKGTPGDTTIVVTLPEFEKVFEEKSKIFLSGKCISASEHAEVWPNNRTGCLYFKSVRATEPGMLRTPPLYTYNVLDNRVTLSEDRWLRDTYAYMVCLTKHLQGCEKNMTVLERVLGAGEESFEYGLTWARYSPVSREWIEVARKLYAKGIKLSPIAEQLLLQTLPETPRRNRAKLDTVQDSNLDRAQQLLATIGVDTERFSFLIVDEVEGESYSSTTNVAGKTEYLIPVKYLDSMASIAAALLDVHVRESQKSWREPTSLDACRLAIRLAQQLHKEFI